MSGRTPRGALSTAILAAALQLLLAPAFGIPFNPNPPSSLLDVTANYSPSAKFNTQLGVTSKLGITSYKANVLNAARRKEGFWWPDPASNRGTYDLAGADQLSENVSWGWHHPNGFYNTIPVGAPLIDGEMNIYLGSDEAVRKFDIMGNMVWIYAPRGQLVAAPTLALSLSRRLKMQAGELILDDDEAESELKPSVFGGGGDGSDGPINDIKEGDILKVRAGMGYSADGKEFYSAGDIGQITKVVDQGGQQVAYITWQRTHHRSVSRTGDIHKRFRKMKVKMDNTTTGNTTSMLVGSTHNGFVFAIDLVTGEELWTTQVCDMIQGVKGSVSVKDGIVVLATDKCLDRYCFRHRYEINPLYWANSAVRGLSVLNGEFLWKFTPRSPVWNFIPQYSDGVNGTTLLFQDMEGSAYAVDLQTGTQKWASYGNMGTYSQGHAIFSPWHNLLYTMLVVHYDEGNGYEAAKVCNPNNVRGIHTNCDTWPGVRGVLWALNASSGKKLFVSTEFQEPPNSGILANPGIGYGHTAHTRLVVTFGHNCHYRSPSWIYMLSPDTLHSRWWSKGPTLWSWDCAGDKEGGDIRRALGQRERCKPGSWSTPVMDVNGDIFVGNQVGELQRWGNPERGGGLHGYQLLSTLNTGVAFQDQAISIGPGIMAVSTCTSLIVLQTDTWNTTFVQNITTVWEDDPIVYPNQPPWPTTKDEGEVGPWPTVKDGKYPPHRR